MNWITQGGGGYRFQYDGANISTELNASYAIVKRYVWGAGADEPLIQYEGGDFATRRYMIADERDSIISVSDANGNALYANSYDEYGIPASTNQGRFQSDRLGDAVHRMANAHSARLHSHSELAVGVESPVPRVGGLP